MDSKSFRRQNFAKLIDTHGITKASEIYGCSESYVSQLRTGHRDIGHRTARKIEKLFDLPDGYMDVLHSDSVGNSEETALTILSDLMSDQPKSVLKKMHDRILRELISDE